MGVAPRSAVVVVVVLCASLVAASGRAQDDPRLAEAMQRFTAAERIFEQGDYRGALAEFQRIYDLLEGHPRRAFVQWDMGRCHEQLFRYDLALAAYQRYLDEGGATDDIARARARATIDDLRSRLGTLRFGPSTPRAEIWIEDRMVGEAPGDVVVPGGRHAVELRAPGYAPWRREIDVLSQVVTAVDAQLQFLREVEATLTFQGAQRGVEVAIDGAAIGVTPIDDGVRVMPGTHRLTASRAGYVSIDRELLVQDGEHVQLDVSLEVDASAPTGTLHLRLPDAEVRTMRVDGAETPVAHDLVLPVGPHTIELDVVDRAHASLEVQIAENEIVTPELPLTWTPAARERWLAASSARRMEGWIVSAIGGAIFVGSTIGLAATLVDVAANDVLSTSVRQRRTSLYDAIEAARGGCDPADSAALGSETALTDLRNGDIPSGYDSAGAGRCGAMVTSSDAFRAAMAMPMSPTGSGVEAGPVIFTAIGAGVGVIVLLVGVSHLLGAPMDVEADGAARVEVTPVIAPGYVGVAGRF